MTIYKDAIPMLGGEVVMGQLFPLAYLAYTLGYLPWSSTLSPGYEGYFRCKAKDQGLEEGCEED